MKILVLSQYWHPENGVPQRRWTWLSKILVDAGHEVTVIAPPPHYQRKIELKQWWAERGFRSGAELARGPAGEHIVRTGFFPSGPSLTRRVINQAAVALGSIWVMLRRSGELKNYYPDLVIGTVPALPTAVAAALAGRRFKVPYVIDLRDAWPDLLDEARNWNKGTRRRSLRERLLVLGPFQVLRSATRWSINKVLKNAAAILVTSSYLERGLRGRQELKKTERRPFLSTIRNVFPSETQIDRRENDGSSKGLNVLYAGTLGRAQNLENAILAVGIAKSRGVDIRLRLVGAGVARNSLIEIIREKDLDVRIEKRRPADELRSYYRWADTALVHLTNWEPLTRTVPSKTYELMAAGIHITGVVSGETAELIRMLKAGDVVAPEDPCALATLWENLAAERSKLNVPNTGAAWVNRERTTVVPENLLKVLDKVVEFR